MAGFDLKKFLEGAVAQVNPWDNGKTFSSVYASTQPAQQQTPRPASTAQPRFSPQVQQRMAQNDANLKRTQQNVFNPLAIIGDVGDAIGGAAQGVGKIAADTINNAGNRVADFGQAGAEVIREATGQNQADYELNKRRADEYKRMADSFAQRAQVEADPVRRQNYLNQVRSLGVAQGNVLNNNTQDINRGLEATDPRKTLTNAAETALDLATAGKGASLLGGVKSLASPLTRQTVQQLGVNAAKTAGQGALIGGAYGGVNTARDPNAQFSDYASNIGQSALLGGAVGLGAQVALPVAAKATTGLVNAGVRGAEAAAPVVANAARATNRVVEQFNPAVKELDNTLAQYQRAFDVETDPTRRLQINQGIADLNGQRRQLVQGGYARIPGKDTTPNQAIRSEIGPDAERLLDQTSPSSPSRDAVVAQGRQRQGLGQPTGRGDQTQRNRGFIDTIFNDSTTSNEVRQSLIDLDTSYAVRNTKELQTKAANLVAQDPDLALRIAKNDKTDIGSSVGSELIKRLQNEGNFEQAVDIANTIAKQATESGRYNQALSIYGKLTPEGILRFANSEINKYNELVKPKNLAKLTPADAKRITAMSQELQGMPEGRPKDIATATLIAEVQKLMPSTIAEKIGTFQTMAQLLNPKTMVRNEVGNAMFGLADNISQVVGTPIDAVTSFLSGRERTTGLPSVKTQLKANLQGRREGTSEAWKGINTGATSQFDLNSVPVFRGKVLGTGERIMGAALRGGDRANYEAAYQDSIRMLKKVRKTDIISAEMEEQANLTALQRTFQDNSVAARAFTGLKKSLNQIGIGTEGKKFGLGDLVLKYPKTPANLLSRGLAYSPAGFANSLFQLAKPLIGKEFNQKAFVDSFSRAIVGSAGSFGLGYVLADKGIITPSPSDDKDLRTLEKQSGLGGYQINADGLLRWISSGFNDSEAKLKQGDNLVSYDWAQPLAVPLSAGAALGEKRPEKSGAAAADSLLNSANTLVEQPLLQGVQGLLGGNKTLSENATDTAVSAPASFIPTLANQITQLFDNTYRDTAGSNPGGTALNKLLAKVPGLAQTLAAQVDLNGQDRERYQNGSNNVFNVMLNPSFSSQYKPQGSNQLPLDIYNQSGETKQVPTVVAKNQKINGEDIKLTPEQNRDLQRYVGTKTTDYLNTVAQDNKFLSLSTADQAKRISETISDIQSAGRIEVLGNNPDKINKSVKSILNSGAANVNASATGGISDTKLPTTSKSYSFLDGASTIESGNKSAWKREAVSDDYKGLVANINSVLPKNLPPLPETNGVAEIYAQFEKDKADKNWSELQTKKESVKVMRNAYKSLLSDNEQFISTLSDAEVVDAAESGQISKEELENVITLDGILKELGGTQMIGNKARTALGYATLASKSGSKSGSKGGKKGSKSKLDYTAGLLSTNKAAQANQDAVRNLVKNVKITRKKI